MKIVLNAYLDNNSYLDNNLGGDLMIKLFAEYFSTDDIYINVDNTIFKEPFKEITNIHFFKTSQLYDHLATSDIHVTIGGSLFTLSNYKAWIFFIKRIKIARFLHRKKIKSAIIGCNFGPFDQHNIGFKIAKLQLKYKNLITVRDKKSFDMLNNDKRFKKKMVRCLPDIVFSWQKYEENFLERNSLGISAYRSLDSQIENKKTYKSLSKIADKYIETYKRKVYLFAFDCGRENDLVAAEYIKKYSNHKDFIEVVPYFGNMEEVLEKINKCEAMIAIRFHSAILAGILSIPFWAIAYSNKMRNLMQENNGSKFLSEITEIENDLDAIDEAILNKDLYRFENIDRLKKSSKQHFKLVEDLINLES